MIENPKILTGSPAKVEKELAEYLASHPNAAVLSSAVTSSTKLSAISSSAVECIKPAKPKAKSKTEDSSEKPWMITGVPCMDVHEITVCIVVGIKL